MGISQIDGVIGNLTLDREADVSLAIQLYERLRLAVLSGEFSQGTQLPASRLLAKELGVARSTVVSAYDQLVAEGYIEGRTGAGMFVVSDILPDDSLRAEETASKSKQPQAELKQDRFPREVDVIDFKPFDTNKMAFDQFPFEDWSRLLSKSWRAPLETICVGHQVGGHWSLRAAVAAYLNDARGIKCEPEQVFITSGSRESITLILSTVAKRSDTVWLEDPGYSGVYQTVLDLDMKPVAVAIDDQGFDVELALEREKNAKVAAVMPPRNFPLGITMSVPRRIALLDWAARKDGWIIEDDFDSEYRYSGRPLSPMVNLDKPGRVFYLGSFSKVMFNSLRLGYFVAPERMVEPINHTASIHGVRASMIAQPALADFIQTGGFSAHIRRMRRIYRERQKTLINALKIYCKDLFYIGVQDAGMNLVVKFSNDLKRKTSDLEARALLAKEGIAAEPLSNFYFGEVKEQGFQLGFSGWETDEINKAMRKMSELLSSYSKS